MSEFGLLLEKELAIKTFDYPEDGTRRESTKRILNFGVEPYDGEEGKTNLLHAIDLNTLTPEDIAILINPKYLEYAWEGRNPRERRDRLESIINKDLGGNRGHQLIYGSGPAEMRRESKIDQDGDGYLTDQERPVKTSSYKTFNANKVDDKEYIIFDLNRFKNVLGQLDKADEDYTFENLSDDYLRNASESEEPVPIDPHDILYGEPEDNVDPDFVDERPIEPKEIEKAAEKADVEVEPEPEVDISFEPDDVERDEVDSKFEPPSPTISIKQKPDIEVEPELGPEKKLPKPKKIELAPDIEKAIDQRVKKEVEKEVEKEKIETAIDDRVEEPEEPEESEPAPEISPKTKEKADIENNIDKALAEVGL